MIPMCNDVNKPKLLIGHNVAFDRSYVQEAYQLKVKKSCYVQFVMMILNIEKVSKPENILFI